MIICRKKAQIAISPCAFYSPRQMRSYHIGAETDRVKIFNIFVDFINPVCIISVFGVYPFISQEYASNKSNREILFFNGL
jgi:hypothetical protein